MIEGIRLGFMVVPKNFHDAFIHVKYVSDIASSGLIQRFLHRFIQLGHYDSHLETVTLEMNIRRQRIQSILNGYSFIKVPRCQSGFSVWVNSERPITSPHLPWQPGEAFSFNPEMRSFFRISFMHLDKEGFETSLPFLDRVLTASAAA
jgi:DNA-binding transcriptional MocR family regulator